MQLSTRQILLIGGAILAIGGTIFILFTNLQGGKGGFDGTTPTKKTRLVVWGVDEPAAFSGIIKNFEAYQKEVDVIYVQYAETAIEEALTNALALNQGPDVIMVKNRTLKRQLNKLTPVPETKINIAALQSLFPTVVEQDFVDARSRRIYALPLYVDTLALLYNKGFFDQASIVRPPQIWNEFNDLVPKLAKFGEGGNISRAAIALGGSDRSITNAADIFTLFLLQNEAPLQKGELDVEQRGLVAFDFYTQFANPRSPNYTWNDKQENDLTSFANLRSAMVLAYKRQIPRITNQNAFLSFGTAAVPQVAGANFEVSYADYWGLGVPRESKQPVVAWEFVTYATIQPVNAELYQKATKRPPALRTLIQKNLSDPEMGVFAKQALTARSWPSPGDDLIRPLFSDMISAFLSGQAEAETALGRAQASLSQLFR